jgi:hypothetical protein
MGLLRMVAVQRMLESVESMALGNAVRWMLVLMIEANSQGSFRGEARLSATR